MEQRQIACDQLHQLMIPAMPIDEENATEPAVNQRLCQVANDAVVGLGSQLHRAAKRHMMVR